MTHMLAHGEPSHVVNVGSVGGYSPLPKLTVYTVPKHYVRVFTNLLYHEYHGSNIQVSALHPGGTLTEFPVLAGQRIKKFALKTMMTPEQVAEIAYPAILKGKRVIIPGIIKKLAVLMGKLLPFPWAKGWYVLLPRGDVPNFSFGSFRKSPWLKRAACGSREAVLSQLTGAGIFTKMLLGILFSSMGLFLATFFLPLLFPFDLEKYLKFHYLKARDQTLTVLDVFARDGKRRGLPVENIQILLQGLLDSA